MTARDYSIQIQCPACKFEHIYHEREMQPWPPEPGESRTVKCRYVTYLEERINSGVHLARNELAHRGPITHIQITF